MRGDYAGRNGDVDGAEGQCNVRVFCSYPGRRYPWDKMCIRDRYDTDIKALQEQIGKAKLDGALEAALAGSRARSTKAVRALLDMERVKRDGDTLIGLEDQLKALKASDPYLFESTVPVSYTHLSGGFI